ncbi:hypothetical protein HDU83_006462 [Entophlyctis luteolus]|nr:hypothetical protein HDU83_006462 [Entophlyctis luteolus]
MHASTTQAPAAVTGGTTAASGSSAAAHAPAGDQSHSSLLDASSIGIAGSSSSSGAGIGGAAYPQALFVLEKELPQQQHLGSVLGVSHLIGGGGGSSVTLPLRQQQQQQPLLAFATNSNANGPNANATAIFMDDFPSVLTTSTQRAAMSAFNNANGAGFSALSSIAGLKQQQLLLLQQEQQQQRMGIGNAAVTNLNFPPGVPLNTTTNGLLPISQGGTALSI